HRLPGRGNAALLAALLALSPATRTEGCPSRARLDRGDGAAARVGRRGRLAQIAEDGAGPGRSWDEERLELLQRLDGAHRHEDVPRPQDRVRGGLRMHLPV